MFGKMEKDERDLCMKFFREGKIQTLIATNMLARGIDVKEIELVINYDVPARKGPYETEVGDPEMYLHRIGRAGRFGIEGIAITLIDR